MSLPFDDFWKAYPKRKGSNPKFLARTKWDKAIREGADPQHLVGAAKAYARQCSEAGQLGTEFVCQASTWLNQRRYEDFHVMSTEMEAKIDADMAKLGWIWTGEKWAKKEMATA